MGRIRVRLSLALLVGIVVGLLRWIVPVGPPREPLANVLLAFIIAGLAFSLTLLRTLLRMDAAATRSHVDGEDPGAAISDVIVIVVGLLGLCAVAVLLIGTSSTGTEQVVDALIGVVAIAVGWLLVHTVYLLRYARIYYSSPVPPIDFKQDADPQFSDFAYFAFNNGMAYQVSDTDLKDSAIRRVVLGQCLLGYVYGTVIIAATINLISGLAGRGG
ncbi:MAG: DUF1345 domain-containing protein [Intrasporangium sp.]|uniref:DUF1345 domain-containing protein n=1 Tax=Intrasporangium sp. TaxID=1925024 RepID=UPI00264A2501|nr:DUF1345 domain-containing protein [Intrasporangium sp.]MDN5798056.1 DUF1345 domain-containing protein [Intrasporangium sp.]